jgi:hypothetical protein
MARRSAAVRFQAFLSQPPVTQAVRRCPTEFIGQLMEGQNTSVLAEHEFAEVRSIVFRGILAGIVGGVAAGMMAGAFYDLFIFFQYNQGPSFSSLNVPLLFITSIQSGLETALTAGLPFGFMIGLITGLLAATFRQHCPRLIVWLVLSCVAMITGNYFSVYFEYSIFPNWGSLVALTIISVAPSWMAYKFTISKIKNDVPGKASPAYAILASLSYLFLMFGVTYGFFYLENMMDRS